MSGVGEGERCTVYPSRRMSVACTLADDLLSPQSRILLRSFGHHNLSSVIEEYFAYRVAHDTVSPARLTTAGRRAGDARKVDRRIGA